jgi:hypothetical protein
MSGTIYSAGILRIMVIKNKVPAPVPPVKNGYIYSEFMFVRVLIINITRMCDQWTSRAY